MSDEQNMDRQAAEMNRVLESARKTIQRSRELRQEILGEKAADPAALRRFIEQQPEEIRGDFDRQMRAMQDDAEREREQQMATVRQVRVKPTRSMV